MTDALLETNLPLLNKRVGKVRDVYDVSLEDGSDGVLIVATDRVSVFDVVLANGIPGKGVLLTQISSFWFDYLGSRFDHHLISTNVGDVPGLSTQDRALLQGRIMLCRKTRVVPVECIVRGYLTGSGYKDYLRTGEVCGIRLPAGMTNSDRIAEPLFTPSTKAESGHDENVSAARAGELVGVALIQQLERLSLSIYQVGRDYAAARGIIIADTKMEFGIDSAGKVILIDEVLTPDSSRFWPADQWQPGREQDSFDKQIVRNYCETLVSAGQWNKEYPGPMLPDDIINKTLGRYEEALDRLKD